MPRAWAGRRQTRGKERTEEVNVESNVASGAAFQALAARVMGEHLGCSFRLEVPLAIGSPAKNHRFDLVSADGRFVGECKSFTWTATGKMPSAKITTMNEAVFYLSFLPDRVMRFLVVKRDLRHGHGESLADYFWRTNRHLLAGVRVYEIDLSTLDLREIGR